MCLLVLAWEVHPRFRLVVAANRDEFHDRPSAALDRWPAPDDILAGRDLRAGGTWLGMDRRRRFAVVTNFRERQRPAVHAPSRGNLIPAYLRGARSAQQYLTELEPSAREYSGFNLLLTDHDSLWYASNRAERFARALPPGIYGLSNELLDTPWPKLRRVRRSFDPLLQQCDVTTQELFSLLADTTPAGVDEELPRSGLPPEWERLLSSPFVLNPQYGTRCSTVLLLERSGACTLAERRFDPEGRPNGETSFTLEAGGWP